MMKLTEIQHGRYYGRRERRKNPVQSAERIFQVMETLADHGEMGLMELSTALDLHKSTVHRLLMSLIYMGYAKQDEATQKYMLSYKVVNMAGKILERMDILQVAKPYMERLSDLSGEAVHLVQREGNHILYIYKIEAKVGTIRMVSHVGMVHPMYCSGVGKAIMATLPDEEVKKIWNESIIEKRRTRRSRISRRCRKYWMKCGRMATRWMMRRTKRASAASQPACTATRKR